MNTMTRRIPKVLPVVAAWIGLAVGQADAWAEDAAAATKPGDKAAAKKASSKKGRAAKAKGPSANGEKKAASLLPKPPKRSISTQPVKIEKPIWNQKAGFGLPVPPGWTGKVDGSKIVLTSPDPPDKQTIITLGPEPTELEASEYLRELSRKLGEQKILTLPQEPKDILDVRIYLVGFMDNRAEPPGFGAVLVYDRPGDQVFVIRALTRDQAIMNDVSVLASIAMVRFRGEPLPNFGQLVGLGKKKVRLELGKVEVKPGAGTLSEFRVPKSIQRLARGMKFKGEMHRYRVGIVTPKGYNAARSWPVLLVDAPATEEEIARYQGLADGAGLVVFAVGPTDEGTIWPPAIRARIYYATLTRLGLRMILDRSRVYVMGTGQAGGRAQATAVELPLARGAIAHATAQDTLTAAVAKSEEAKKRLALAAVWPASGKDVTKAQADALVAAWKKAGVATVQGFSDDSDGKAIRKAVDWLLERDRSVVEANLDQLLAQAGTLAKDRSGQALTIYRHIVGSGLKNPKVDQAAKAAQALRDECNQVLKVVTTQASGGKADPVIAQFKIVQRFQGTPEGGELLQAIRMQLEAQ